MANPRTPAEAIAGRLLGSYGDVATLAALVDARVYPSTPTQEPAGDYVAFWRTGGGDGAKLSGANGLRAYEMRVECTATTEAAAEAILAAVDDLLSGWRDRDIGVQGCFAVGDSDENPLDDGRQVSGKSYQLWFKAVA